MSEDKTQQNADALLAAMATIGDWAEEIDGSVMACAKALARCQVLRTGSRVCSRIDSCEPRRASGLSFQRHSHILKNVRMSPRRARRAIWRWTSDDWPNPRQPARPLEPG